ncbi:hypothetical protein QM797_16910 [Rhodococcus sp. IEGM 1381]|uniref:hypothetical protein n=1 Tax=Rhodococcus sp. IEGM 1381 TaxID=3047085 RepID=UPI0024B79E03|nr:hypothetical protein [Rhodococcus sp. IEGM 1381]MDI9896409.1 hypothetical protein [Rhodococcus sp. IEGM 1381]
MGRTENAGDETPTVDKKSTTPDSPKGGRPGPVDGGGGGGMATRENAPEIAEDSA